MEGQDIRGLIEAYSQVYETPEVSEEVVEESVEQIDEIAVNFAASGAAKNRSQAAAVRSNLQKGGSVNISGPQGFFGGRDKAGTAKLDTAATKSQGRTVLSFNQAQTSGGFRGSQKGAYTPNTTVVGGEKMYKAKLGGKDVYVGAKKPGQTAPAAAKPAAPAAAAKPAAPAAAPKPAAPAAAPKPAATSAPKPAPAPTKPAGSAMDQWRAANPKLAAAADEKARIRGTSQTDNPLMKDMRSKMSMTPSVQSPTLAKDLGKGGGNQSLLNNPNASKAAPPKPVATTAPKPTAAAKPSGFDLAKKGVNLAADVDIFDLVKGYLLDEGYAETEQNAIVMMANMSEEWRKSILEAHGVEKDEGGKHKEGKHPKGKEEKGEKVTEKEGKEKEDEKEMKEGLSYSAKSARAGEDIGKPGKQFEKIAKEAGERYGSKERGEKVAGAVLAKLRAKKG
jgi:hypothetical protein